MRAERGHTVGFSGMISELLPGLYARANRFHGGFVARLVNWLKPRRVVMYPLVLMLGAAGFFVAGEAVLLSRGYRLVNTLGVDFLPFFSGGRFLWQGRMDELYNVSAHQADQATYAVLLEPERVGVFINPPFTALVYAPFAWLSYEAGLFTWWIAGLSSLLLAVLIFRRTLGLQRIITGWRLLLGAGLFYPTLAWFVYGQNAAFSLLLYTGGYFLLRQKREFAAGLLLGCLIHKPQLLLGFGAILLLKRRWRAVSGLALTVGTWVAIGFALSPQAMLAYGPFSKVAYQIQGPVLWVEHSLAGFALLLLGQIWPVGAVVLAAGFTVAGLLILARWWGRRAWEPGTREWDLAMAASIALGLLISPHLVVYDLMLLLLPLWIVCSYYRSGMAGRALDGGPLLAWTALLWVATFLSSYLSLLQLELAAAVGLPAIVLQISVPIILIWAVHVEHAARLPEASVLSAPETHASAALVPN